MLLLVREAEELLRALHQQGAFPGAGEGRLMVQHPLGKPFAHLWTHPDTQGQGRGTLWSALTAPRAEGWVGGLCDKLWWFVTNLYRGKTEAPGPYTPASSAFGWQSCILWASAADQRRARGGKDDFGLEEGP